MQKRSYAGNNGSELHSLHRVIESKLQTKKEALNEDENSHCTFKPAILRNKNLSKLLSSSGVAPDLRVSNIERASVVDR